MSSKENKRSRAPGCLITLALLLIFLLAALHFTAPLIVRKIANHRLPELLQTQARVDQVHLNLITGTFGIRNLVVEQPEGFEGDPLLQLRSLNILIPIGKAIRQDPIVIRDLHLDGLDLHLITDTNAVINVARIGPPTPEKPAFKPKTESAPPPPVWIQELLLENIRLTLHDLASEWKLQIDDIQLKVEHLRIAHGDPGDPAIIRLDLTLPESRTPGRLLVRAKTGPIHPTRVDHLPPMQIAIGLFGFDLDLIDPFLVPGARTAIGGTGLEMQSLIAIHPGDTKAEQVLSGSSELTTDGGHTIRGNTGGTVANPNLPIVSILGSIVGNQFGRVTQWSGNIAKGGFEASKTVAKTGGEAVKGVGRTVGKFGGGIFKTAAGVVTLDAEATKQGMSDATLGTVGEAAGTVVKTTGAAWSGLGSTVRVTTGKTDKDRWWSQVAQREQAFEANVTTWFADNPFPPGPQESAPDPAEQTDAPENETLPDSGPEQRPLTEF